VEYYVTTQLFLCFFTPMLQKGLGLQFSTSFDGRWTSTCINTEHLWNEAERGKAKYYERPSQWHFVRIEPTWTVLKSDG